MLPLIALSFLTESPIRPPALCSPRNASPHIRLTVPRMRLPARRVLRRQCLIARDLHVLHILVLGGLRIVERAAGDDLPIDDDDLYYEQWRAGHRSASECRNWLRSRRRSIYRYDSTCPEWRPPELSRSGPR